MTRRLAGAIAGGIIGTAVAIETCVALGVHGFASGFVGLVCGYIGATIGSELAAAR